VIAEGMAEGMGQRVGVISPGGTVLEVAEDGGGGVWLATGAGIFRRHGGSWRPLAQGQPLTQVSALVCAGEVLFAGGGLGQIAYSRDGGQSWYRGQLSQTSEPITCLAISPAYQRDGVVLAGTNGAGILRSTDGGRRWESSGFGLQDFSILALAAAPGWGWREVVFAGTAHGLYRSPNGGRAWKRSDSGFGDPAVQSIAVSPDFERDGTILAGTEADGLLRSTDGGKTWQMSSIAERESPPINALWLHPGFATTPICLAGTGDGRIFRSLDGGASWSAVATGSAPVLCLSGVGSDTSPAAGQRLYAGLHDEGMLVSEDGGQTWSQERGLAARAITRLVWGGGRNLFAWGPLEGAWHSADGGQRWAQVPGLQDSLPLMALAASPAAGRPCLLVGTSAGIRRSTDRGQTWQVVLGANAISIAFSPEFGVDGRVWVGTDRGDILASSDRGLSWTDRHPPLPGVPLVALAAWPGPLGAETLLVATFEAGRRQVRIWRSVDGGQSWAQWLQEAADRPSVHLSLADVASGGAVVCIGRICWQATVTDWRPTRSLETDRPILRLVRAPNSAGLIALAPGGVLRSADGLDWSFPSGGVPDWELSDLALLPGWDSDHLVYVLGTGGVVWRRPL
jgi:photosystem II stability/assembly factor-like uncharacterized protein